MVSNLKFIYFVIILLFLIFAIKISIYYFPKEKTVIEKTAIDINKNPVKTLDFSYVNVDNKIIDTFTIPQGTFNVDVFVIITSDTLLARKITGWEIGESLGITGSNVVWISDPKDRGLVSHELFHVTYYIMKYSGVPLSDSSEEVYAYELQRLIENFYEQYNRAK